MSSYKVVSSQDKGRCVVATVDFAAGDIVLEDEPFAATVRQDEVELRSHWSFEEGENLLRCSKCKFVRYKNRAEQQLDWENGHKQECKSLRNRAPDYPGPAMRLIARCLWRNLREGVKPKTEAEEISGTFKDVLDLENHKKKARMDMRLRFGEMARLCIAYMDANRDLGAHFLNYNFSEAEQLFAMLSCNGFTITDNEFQPIGTGLYCMAALVNHSCQPNSAQTYVGRKIVMRALKDIKAGEEITVTYVPLSATKLERRKALIERYYFDIFSEQEQKNLKTMRPLEKRTMSHLNLEVRILVWKQPPWELNDYDQQLTRIVIRQDQKSDMVIPNCGFSAEFTNQEWEQHELKDMQQKSVWGGEEDENPFIADMAQSLKEERTKRGKVYYPFTANENEDSAESEWDGGSGSANIVINVWGQAFSNNEGKIPWPHIGRLAKFAVSALVVERNESMANERNEDLCTKEFDRICKTAEACELQGVDPKKGYLTLGRMHVIRYKFYEAQFKMARSFALWREAYDIGKKLRPFKLFMEHGPEIILHDIFMAGTAHFLEEPRQCVLYAQSARKQISALKLNSSFEIQIRDMYLKLRDCLELIKEENEKKQLKEK